MYSQVIVNVDSKLKSRAMKKAKIAGVPFSSILKMAIKDFVDGYLDIGLFKTEKFNDKTSKRISLALEDIAKGRNLSPAFSSADEAIAYLRK